MRMTKRTTLLLVSSVAMLSMLTAAFVAFHGSSRAADSPLPFTQQHFNGFDILANSGDGAPASLGDLKNPPSPVCATATSAAANVNTDCELSPHNETGIAVNPTNPANIIGGANDYQLILTSGGALKETVFTRAHVTFDGGQTWTDYPITTPQYSATGDPAVAFDASGTAYLATLGFLFSEGRSPTETAPDVIVSHSSDGGKTWVGPVRVATGTGSLGSVSTFNDKEYIAAWGSGNAIVTWTVFNDGIHGNTINSPIFDVVTHDGGKTWTSPTEISGSASFCIGALPSAPTACDQDQFSVPAVAAGGGSISVAFESLANATNGRDQYLVVKVDPTDGHALAGPSQVTQLVDGGTDYPINEDGRPTYHDSEFRSNSAGNIAADPTNSLHLAVVWSDMRNGAATSSNPYLTTTNSDIGVSQSFDGGVTWSTTPTIITAPGDQFMPWGAYDTSGKLRIGYFDRQYDPANRMYGYTVATETAPGSLTFTTTQVTTTLSDPTTGDRWFSGRTPNAGFPHPTSFLGDYSGIAATPSGGVATLWTDMRNTACFTVRCGSGEDTFYGTAP